MYVARYGLHLRFRDEQQLRRDYGPVRGWGGVRWVSRGGIKRRRGPDIRNGFSRGANRVCTLGLSRPDGGCLVS